MDWLGWTLGVIAVTVMFDATCMALLLRAHRNHSDDGV